jgi:hypothetical protein
LNWSLGSRRARRSQGPRVDVEVDPAFVDVVVDQVAIPDEGYRPAGSA